MKPVARHRRHHRPFDQKILARSRRHISSAHAVPPLPIPPESRFGAYQSPSLA